MWARSRFHAHFAAGVVERGHVLHVGAVTVDKQQIAPHHGRAGRPVSVGVLQLVGLPHDVAAGGQTHRAVCAEMDVHAVFVDHRRRRGMAVVGVDRTGIVELEDLDVVYHGAAGAVDTDRAQRMSLVDGRGDPDLISLDGRRRPAESWDGRFPGDVFRFAPGEGHALRRGVSLSERTAELGPVGGMGDRRKRCRKQCGCQGMSDHGGLAGQGAIRLTHNRPPRNRPLQVQTLTAGCCPRRAKSTAKKHGL